MDYKALAVSQAFGLAFLNGVSIWILALCYIPAMILIYCLLPNREEKTKN